MRKSQEAMTVAKVDQSMRLVFGWGSVCQKRNEAGELEQYYDTDNQAFPEDVTIKGWCEFMGDVRVHKAMHDGEPVGEVIFAFPVTDEIFKSLGLEVGSQTGVIVAVKVNDDNVLEKFHNKTYKGFSIGGSATFEDVA